MGRSLACVTGFGHLASVITEPGGGQSLQPQAPAKAWTRPQLVHRTEPSDWLDVGDRVASAVYLWVHSTSEEDHTAPARATSAHTS